MKMRDETKSSDDRRASVKMDSMQGDIKGDDRAAGKRGMQ